MLQTFTVCVTVRYRVRVLCNRVIQKALSELYYQILETKSRTSW